MRTLLCMDWYGMPARKEDDPVAALSEFQSVVDMKKRKENGKDKLFCKRAAYSYSTDSGDSRPWNKWQKYPTDCAGARTQV